MDCLRTAKISSMISMIVVAWLVAASPAPASPLFGAEAGTFGGGNDIPAPSSFEQSATSFFEFSEPSFPLNFRRENAVAVAGPGRLAVNVQAITHYPNAIPSLGPSLQLHSAYAEAFFVLDDIIIRLASDPDFVGTVQGSYNLELAGALYTNAVAIGGAGTSTASSSVSFNSFTNLLGSPQLGGTLGKYSSSQAPAGLGSSGEGGTGALANGFAGSELFTSAVQTLRVGSPFGITVRLRVDVNMEPRRTGEPAPSEFRSVEGGGGFLSTLSLPANAQVFTLPPGYTVSSASGLIDDNQFLPEPGTGAGVLFGLGWISCLRHWRHAKTRS